MADTSLEIAENQKETRLHNEVAHHTCHARPYAQGDILVLYVWFWNKSGNLLSYFFDILDTPKLT